jgi:hypothetical protein
MLVVLLEVFSTMPEASVTEYELVETPAEAPITVIASFFTAQDKIQSPIGLMIINKTDHLVVIDWDRCALILPDGRSERVIHVGVRYLEKAAPQAPTPIPPSAEVEEAIWPSNFIRWRSGYGNTSGGWEEDPIRVSPGDVIKLYLTWETGGQGASGSWAYKYTPSLFMYLDSEDATVKHGATSTATVNVVRRAGFTDAVLLAAEGVPTGVQVEIHPNPALGDRSTLTIAADRTATPGRYPIRVRGTSGSLVTHTTNLLTLTVQRADVGEDTPPSAEAAPTEGGPLGDRSIRAPGPAYPPSWLWILLLLFLGTGLAVALGR